MRVRVAPKDMSFTRRMRKPAPIGWEPKEIYSLGIMMNCALAKPTAETHPSIIEAHSYFYNGFRPPHYPHILSLTREPLVLILMGVYVANGWEKKIGDEATMEQIHDFVRATWGFVNSKKTYAVPAPPDSRRIWPGKTHKARNQSEVPRAVKLLDKKTFNRLKKECPTCFMSALGKAPLHSL